MHAKPDLRVVLKMGDRWFGLGDRGRYPAFTESHIALKTFSLSILVVAALALIGFCVIQFVRPMPVSGYAEWLDLDRATYDHIDNVAASEFRNRIYVYTENQFVDAIPGCAARPNTANDQRHVPALRCNGDIYVILRKCINESGGLAISDDPNFASKPIEFDDDFVVEHVSGNVYHWDLDMERDSFR